MFTFKQCKCGGTNFSDIDDEGTYRCEDCGRLAKIQYIYDEEVEQND